MNLMMLLEMAAEGFGERVAIQNGADRLTYTQLFASAGAAAVDVARGGGERLVVLDVNSLAIPVGLFAAAWAGVPFVPLNYRLTGAELERLLAGIAAPYLVTDAARVDALALQAHVVRAREDFLARARTANGAPGSSTAPPSSSPARC